MNCHLLPALVLQPVLPMRVNFDAALFSEGDKPLKIIAAQSSQVAERS